MCLPWSFSFLSVLWDPGLDGSLVQPSMVIHLPLGVELETLQDLPFKVTMHAELARTAWYKDLSPGTSQTSLGTSQTSLGMISCLGVWKGDVGDGFSLYPSLQLWFWKGTLSNYKAEEDKNSDCRFKPIGKLCDPIRHTCQLWDGANPLHLTYFSLKNIWSHPDSCPLVLLCELAQG